MILNHIINVIESPFKSLIATISGGIIGYIPTTINMVGNIKNNTIDKMFQHTVWTITILVGITAIVTWIQKQRDRWLEKHPKNNRDFLYNNIEEDDED